MLRPQLHSTSANLISSYKPQVGSYRAALINVNCRTLGNDKAQQTLVRFARTYDLPRVPTVNNEYFQRPHLHLCIFNLTTHHAPRVRFRMHTCRNPDHTRYTYLTCISVQSPPLNMSINPEDIPSKRRLGDEPPAVGASDRISALRRNSTSERLLTKGSQKPKMGSSKSWTTPKPQHDHKRKTYRCTHPRFLAPTYSAAA